MMMPCARVTSSLSIIHVLLVAWLRQCGVRGELLVLVFVLVLFFLYCCAPTLI
jgi:hypothetical protein